MATRPVRPQFGDQKPRERAGHSAIQAEPAPVPLRESEDFDLAAEPTCFTNEPSTEPWVLTVADAQAAIDSWEDPREPSEDLKAAYKQYLEMIRPA